MIFRVLVLIMVLPVGLWAVNPLWRGNASTKKIALTFDDGPKPEYAVPLLDVLKKLGVHATFFVVGKEAKLNPDIIQRMELEGHEVGSHSYTHPPLDSLNAKDLEFEISETNRVLQSITGKPVKYFRPPGGRYTLNVMQTIENHGLKIVMWTVNAEDYTVFSATLNVHGESRESRSNQKLYEKISSKAKGGSIVLMHNGSKETIETLPRIISSLRENGYHLVTISEMLEDAPRTH